MKMLGEIAVQLVALALVIVIMSNILVLVSLR